MKIISLVFVMLWSYSALAKAPLLKIREMQNPPAKVIRTCCSFGSDVSIAHIPFVKKTDIISIDELGMHRYMGGGNEGNGIIYTQNGGFIDLGHMRDYADWTAYLYSIILSAKENEKDIVLEIGAEGGLKTLYVPISQLQNNIDLYELAGSIAYDLSVWHEIATWFGSSYIPMVNEKYSSFSPEDLYSNLLGVRLGILALQSDLEYNEAMTEMITKALDSLGAVRSAEETYSAMEEVESLWWTRKKALPSGKLLLARYLDSNDFLTPWLLPVDSTNYKAHPIKKLSSDLKNQYEIRIELHKGFLAKSLELVDQDRIVTQLDFQWFFSCIEEDKRNMDLKIATKHEKAALRKEERLQGTFNL